MENLCRQFTENDSSFVFENCTKVNDDLNKLAKKFKLSIFFYNGRLTKSRRFGKEMFVVHKNGILLAHANPGKLAKLPAGVNKLHGCKYKLSELINKKCCDDCDIHTDWTKIEQQIGKGINIWRKESTSLNKSTITNLRKSNLQPAIHLHCDKFFCKTFLITCKQLYFRGHRKIINKF